MLIVKKKKKSPTHLISPCVRIVAPIEKITIMTACRKQKLNHVPCVTCHQYQQPQPQTLPLAISPTIHSRLLCLGRKLFLEEPAYLPRNPKKFKTQKNHLKLFKTKLFLSFDQKSPVHRVLGPARGQTHRRTL